MKAYIRENIKLIKMILSLTVLLIGTVVLIKSNDTRAQKLPELSELEIVCCNMDNEVYEYGYTGKEITPKIDRIVLADAEGNVVIKYAEEITIIGYKRNVSLGNADIEFTVNGYRGTLWVKDAFKIVPAQVQELKVTALSNELISLSWAKVEHAKGYLVYRSEDGGKTFTLLHQIDLNEETFFSDETVKSNTQYVYYICSYEQHGRTIYKGIASKHVTLYTSLDTPVLGSAACYGMNAIQLKWNVVNGASGYRIYRYSKTNGEVICIAEILDGKVSTYMDTNCTFDESYSYFIQACQMINEEALYGESSNTVSCNYTLKNVISVLRQYVGKPYIPNSNPSWRGWDCSGFVQLTYKTHFGLSLPRSAASQARVGQKVDKNDRASWKPGDLIFYTEGNGISHVAVYLGDNLIIHALSQKHDTLIQDVDYYERWDGNNRMYCVRRYF